MNSIKTKLTLAFILVGLAPVLSIALFSIRHFETTIEKSGGRHVEGLSGLEAIADLRTAELETYFQERVNDLTVLQNFNVIRKHFPILCSFVDAVSSPEYINEKRILDDQIQLFQSTYGYEGIMLVDADGKIRYTSNDAHQVVHLGRLLPDPGNKAFGEGKKGIYFSDIFSNPQHDGDFEMLLTAPLHDEDDRFIGVVAVGINMNTIFEFVKSTTGLGETGETLLVKQIEGGALFLNPLRHDPDATLNRKTFDGSDIAFPAQRAVKPGQKGSGIYIDYRQEKVFAAWRHLNLTGWGLVTKIDEEEMLQPLKAMSFRIEFMTLFFAIFVIILALLLSITITSPIKKLTLVADAISRGDMSAKVDTKILESKDEAGDLARSFDRIMVSLKLAMRGRSSNNADHKNPLL